MARREHEGEREAGENIVFEWLLRNNYRIYSIKRRGVY